MERDDEYRTCCRLMHVKTATWIIAIVHFIMALVYVLSAILYLAGVTKTHVKYHDHLIDIGKYDSWVVLAVGIIWLAFVVLLIVGLKQDKASFVLAHLIYAAIVFVVSVVKTILVIVQGAATIGNIVWYIVIGLIILVLLFIEYRCYKYLK